VTQLCAIKSGVASLIETEVPGGVRVVGQKIQDIHSAGNVSWRPSFARTLSWCPAGKTEICAGDEVVLVGPGDAIQTAHDIFSQEADTTA